MENGKIEVTSDPLDHEQDEPNVIIQEDVVVVSEVPSKVSKPKTHVVKDGENVQSIAKLYCGSKDRHKYAKDLVKRNGKISVGKTVIL